MISDKIMPINDSGNVLLRYSPPPDGYFFIYNTNNGICSSIAGCREGFAEYFEEEHNWIGFYVANLNIDTLNSFFQEIENRLKLKEKTIFYRTRLNTIVVLEVSQFWLKSFTRRQILTLLLRCGAVYYRGSIEHSLDSYNLGSSVKPTVLYFLSGHTKSIYDEDLLKKAGGFCNYFCRINNDMLSEYFLTKNMKRPKSLTVEDIFKNMPNYKPINVPKQQKETLKSIFGE